MGGYKVQPQSVCKPTCSSVLSSCTLSHCSHQQPNKKPVSQVLVLKVLFLNGHQAFCSRSRFIYSFIHLSSFYHHLVQLWVARAPGTFPSGTRQERGTHPGQVAGPAQGYFHNKVNHLFSCDNSEIIQTHYKLKCHQEFSFLKLPSTVTV